MFNRFFNRLGHHYIGAMLLATRLSGSIGGVAPGPTDAWITLAGLARETSRIRLGTLVSPVTFRHPGVLAIQVAQVEHLEVVAGGIDRDVPALRVVATRPAYSARNALMASLSNGSECR